MMTVTSGRMQARRPHRSGLYPLLRAMFIVRIRKITQKKMTTSHQKNDMCTPLTDDGSSHMSAAVTIDGTFLMLDLLLRPALQPISL